MFQGILRYFRYPSIKLLRMQTYKYPSIKLLRMQTYKHPSIKLLRMQTYKRLLMGLEMEEYDPRSFLCEKGGGLVVSFRGCKLSFLYHL